MKELVLKKWEMNSRKIKLFADQSIISGSNFLIGILMTQLLTLEEIGVFVFVWMVVMMCTNLSQNFISIPMINNYEQLKTNNSDHYLFNLFVVQGALSIAFGIFIFVILYFTPPLYFFIILKKHLITLPILVTTYTFYEFLRRTQVITNKINFLFSVDFLVNCGQVIFLIFCLWQNKTYLGEILLVLTAMYSIGITIGLYATTKTPFSFNDCKSILMAHWKPAKWLLASVLLQWFSGNYFIIIAGSELGEENSGIIRIAQNLVGILNIFFITLEIYIPSIAISLYLKHGKSTLLKYALKITVIGLIACSLLTVVLYFFAGNLLELLYGSQYKQYDSIIILFSLFYTIVFLGYPLRFVLRALNNTQDLFWAYFLATAFSLLTAHQLIQALNIYGVIAGLISTQLIMQFWYIKSILSTSKKKLT